MTNRALPSLRATRTPPPEHLREHGKALWEAVDSEFELEDCTQRTILEMTCQALDRLREAQRILDEQGLVVITKNTTKPHPATAIERDCRIAVLRGLRELGVEPESDDPRPPRVNLRLGRR